MNLLQATLLGIVQGLTEFLPVSSSGHLVLAQSLMGLELPGVVFEIVVHLATLLAVCVVYRRSLGRLVLGVVRGQRAELLYVALLALATVPAALVGFALADTFESIFDRPVFAAAFLLATGAIVYTLRLTVSRAERTTLRTGDAIGVGVAQALAILPGISRSGSTVAAGTALGVDAGRMAEFSFLMSIPAIAGAAVLKMPDMAATGRALGAAPLAVAFVAAAASGVVAIRIFLGMLERRTFHRFAYYCWIVGGAYLAAAAIWPALR